MDGHSPHGNRETPETPLPVGGRGRLGKVLARGGQGRALGTPTRDVDAVLISDYAIGVSTERLLPTLLAKADERRVPVIIDPARIADIRALPGGRGPEAQPVRS
jgi:hypothetical protein